MKSNDSRETIIMDLRNKDHLEQFLSVGHQLTPATMAAKLSRGKWRAAKHLLYISNIIVAAITRGGARIILTMPPRHGKSEFLSVYTPIWYLNLYPDKYVMQISYGLELVTDFSFKVRTAFLNEDNHKYLNIRLQQDKLKIDRFLTTAGGGLTAAGIGGSITGRDADLLLLDDYTKNSETALSKVQRDKDWEWFRSTAYVRLNPGASIIVLATRWGRDDLIGRILKHMGKAWKLINLPAFAEENDPLGRVVGGALWPERYDAAALQDIQRSIGSYWFSSLYQQRPMASLSGSNLGEQIEIVDESMLPHKHHQIKIRAWDLAATATADADYTAGVQLIFDTEKRRYYIVDVRHVQKSPGGVKELIKMCADKDGYNCEIVIEQEPGSAGKHVIDDYANILDGYLFRGVKATGKIEIRAMPLLAAIEAGMVYMLNALWNDKVKEEINSFPNGDHDDILSAMALGYTQIVDNRQASVVWGEKMNAGKSKSRYVTGVVW